MNESFVLEFKEFVTQCIEYEKKRNLADKTIVDLQRYFSLFIDYLEEKAIKRIEGLSPSFFTDFLLSKSTGDNAPLIKAFAWALRKLGNFLYIKQIVTTNPTQHIRYPKISRRAKLPQYLTETQLYDFLKEALKLPLMDFCIISLLATVGLRTNSLAELKQEDVYPFQRLIKLKMKGGWFKRMPLSTHMTELLQKWISSKTIESPYLFPRNNANGVSRDYIRKIVRETGKKTAISFTVTPRTLRHTFATFAADRHGKNITCSLMGHSSTNITSVYTHLAPTKFRRIMMTHPYQNFLERG